MNYDERKLITRRQRQRFFEGLDRRCAMHKRRVERAHENLESAQENYKLCLMGLVLSVWVLIVYINY